MIKKVKKESVKAAAPKKAKAKSKAAPKKEAAKKTKLVKTAPKIIAAPKKVEVPPRKIEEVPLPKKIEKPVIAKKTEAPALKPEVKKTEIAKPEIKKPEARTIASAPAPVPAPVIEKPPAIEEPAEEVKIPEEPKKRVLEVETPISLKDLAIKIGVKPNELIVNLMAKNIFATINQSLG